jgi:hypothetical protein
LTKTETDARRAVLPAACAGGALTAMLFASRLPLTLDFILPRRAGWPLFLRASESLSRPVPRALFTALIVLLAGAAAARFLYLAAAVARGRKWSARKFLTRGFVLALVVALARWSCSVWLEVSQKVWFPFGSLNVLEPLANLLFFCALAFAAMASALAALKALPPSPPRLLVPWAAANALAALLAASFYGAWSPSRAPALAGAGAPGGSRFLYVVLTEEGGKPGRIAYDLPAPPEDGALERAEAGLAKAGTDRLDELRALYEARAKLMDPKGLRRALMLGVKYGDDLARSLLLEHLSAAPPSPEALSALGALADETAHRVGPLGAARIARAYAHLGDAAQASIWARRGADGPRGIPAGLIDLTGGGALAPGRISGRVNGLKPYRIALYRKTDPSAPYLLDAAALVASAEPGADGRFAFSAMTAGRYYLAFAFLQPATPLGELAVSGHRGDVELDARRKYADLALTVKRVPR